MRFGVAESGFLFFYSGIRLGVSRGIVDHSIRRMQLFMLCKFDQFFFLSDLSSINVGDLESYGKMMCPDINIGSQSYETGYGRRS